MGSLGHATVKRCSERKESGKKAKSVEWLKAYLQWCVILHVQRQRDCAMIVKQNGLYFVYDEKRKKKLSKGYKTLAEAKKRLQQIEYFKHKKK
jgi:hypothetical protein